MDLIKIISYYFILIYQSTRFSDYKLNYIKIFIISLYKNILQAHSFTRSFIHSFIRSLGHLYIYIQIIGSTSSFNSIAIMFVLFCLIYSYNEYTTTTIIITASTVNTRNVLTFYDYTYLHILHAFYFTFTFIQLLCILYLPSL